MAGGGIILTVTSVFSMFKGGIMGFVLRAAVAAAIIVSSSIVSGRAFDPAFSQNRSPAVAHPGDLSATRPGGQSNQADPKQRARCEFLQRQMETKASQVQSYFNLYTAKQLEQSRAQSSLIEEMNRPFIIRNNDRILMLRMEIAKLKQIVQKYQSRYNELIEEENRIFREFDGENCLRVLGYIKW